MNPWKSVFSALNDIYVQDARNALACRGSARVRVYKLIFQYLYDTEKTFRVIVKS